MLADAHTAAIVCCHNSVFSDVVPQWTSGLIQSEEGTFTQQTALERKEALYKEAIRLFDQGKTWECGIRLCKELAHLYESQLFDYEKLSWILVSGCAGERGRGRGRGRYMYW